MRHPIRVHCFYRSQVTCIYAACWLLSCVNLAAAEDNILPPADFELLFNGRDFDNWTGGTTRDPREIAAMSPEERADWDAKMNKGIAEHWRVEEGVLVSDGQEPYLATNRDYGDFELWVDWLIGPKGDSGIYLRGAPQVQIWDPTDPDAFHNGSDKGSGALWNNEKLGKFPPEVADRPIGEWNRMFICMVGPYVTVKLNDKLIVDNVVMENYYDRTIPIFARGPIYLQTHGAETRFRNLFVREIPAAEANQLLADLEGDEREFKPLFNGNDLTGWIGATDDFEVVDGAIQTKSGTEGNLLTRDEFDNFVVRLEFKTPPGGNNGLAIRAASPDGTPAYDAIEIQVLDDSADQNRDVEAYQVHGSLYGLAPAMRGFLRPAGEWNYQEVTVDGDHIIVRLNGYEILSADLAKVRQQPVDGKDHPGASRTRGHFGFAGHHDPVAFRNIRIKRLPAKN